MTGPRTFAPIRPPAREHRLSPAAAALLLLGFLGMFIPVCFWIGTSRVSIYSDPGQWSDSQWPPIVAMVLAGTLLCIPLLWVIWSRRMDLVSLSLAQNALIVCGYFFVGITAYKIAWEGREMLRFVPMVLLFNSLGFLVLLITLGLTYGAAALAKFRLPPLKADPGDIDRRLRYLLILVGLVVVIIIAAPMVKSREVPLLAADSTQARFDIVKPPLLRAFYHLGTAMLPFVTGGLVVGIFRRPWRAFGIDGMLVVGIVITQTLTSNRLPLAIGLVVTITLLSMERKLPRLLLVGAFFGYLFAFAGLSGFTGLLRHGNGTLPSGNIVKESLEEAFLGENLIDLRDSAWVFSHWDGQPLEGKTYLGGMASMLPSAIFPQKKEWHLGMTGVRMVGWGEEEHFGLRITFFGESFLNFGWAGVVGLGILLGSAFGLLLRALHLAGNSPRQCLMRNVKIVMGTQMLLPVANTSDAFTSWSMLALYGIFILFVDLPARWAASSVRPRLSSFYAANRV